MMTTPSSFTTGLDSQPSEPGPDGTPASTDSAPWYDTVQSLPDAPAATAAYKPPDPPPTGPSEQLPTIGHIGRYALKYQIGEGGLGRVYAAHDPLLSRLIAIKTLNLEIAADQRDSFNAMFLNEARAAGALSHPHIVTVFDAGVSEQGPYIAMELLKGRDLRQLRLEGWKPTPTQAALIVRRVADALAYAHSKGVVHRDIKPANIFMVGRTQPRVLDFGIARIAHKHDAHAQGDIAGGSPYYMAPEQVRQQPEDRRCDVFSLGVVLYELLTGERPFRGASVQEITAAVVDFVPPRADAVDPSVPKSLADIAARAMEKSPEQRHRSARALARDLRHWLDEHGQESVEPADRPASPAKRRALWSLAAVAALAIAAVAWWALTPQRSSVDGAKSTQVAAPPAALQPAPAASGVAAAASSADTPLSSVAAALPASATLSGSASAAVSTLAVASALPAPAPASASPAPARTPTAKNAVSPRRAREARQAREREAHAAPAPAPALATGVLRLAISPWGEVEVDGKPVGTAPPLNELTLTEGHHTITIRNGEFAPYSAGVTVTPDQPATLKYRFGS